MGTPGAPALPAKPQNQWENFLGDKRLFLNVKHVDSFPFYRPKAVKATNQLTQGQPMIEAETFTECVPRGVYFLNSRKVPR